MKNRQPPGIEPGPLTLAVSALPPELWPQGDSQPSHMYMYAVCCGLKYHLRQLISSHKEKEISSGVVALRCLVSDRSLCTCNQLASDHASIQGPQWCNTCTHVCVHATHATAT